MLQDADEIAEDVLLLVDLAHVGDLSRCDSLQQQHLFVGDIGELAE